MLLCVFNPDAVTHFELTRTQLPSRNGWSLPFWNPEKLNLSYPPEPADSIYLDACVSVCVCVCVYMCACLLPCVGVAERKRAGGAAREKTSAPSSPWGCWGCYDPWRLSNVFPNSRYVCVENVWPLQLPFLEAWETWHQNKGLAPENNTENYPRRFHIVSPATREQQSHLTPRSRPKPLLNFDPRVLLSYNNPSLSWALRLCLTAWWTLWRMCSTSSSSTYSSCSSSPWWLCSSSRGASFSALMSPKNLSAIAGQDSSPTMCSAPRTLEVS